MATMALAGREMERMQERQAVRRTHAGRAPSVAERNRDLYEQQRSRRRGPTPEMFFTKHLDNSRIVKADDPERRREMRSFTIAMTMFFLLTMVYVWQHFSAIEVGYKVEAQKTQVEQLREQNRQLRLTEAELSDPGRIDRIAKQLGLDEPLPGQVVRPDGSGIGSGNAGAVLAQATVPVLHAN
jgi:cell division protein FtsL